jgi:hypothetical protein
MAFSRFVIRSSFLMPRSFKLRNIACGYPGCTKLFTNQAGLKIHFRTHRRQEQLLRRPTVSNRKTPEPIERDDWPSPEFERAHLSDAPSSRHTSPEPGEHPQHTPNNPHRDQGEDVRIHPKINGEFTTYNLVLYSEFIRLSL